MGHLPWWDSIEEETKIIGTMVWCQSCETVVWAHDSNQGDLRGILNMLKLPCRLCGEEANYDGLSVTSIDLERYKNSGIASGAWSVMRALQRYHEVEWGRSPDNTWR